MPTPSWDGRKTPPKNKPKPSVCRQAAGNKDENEDDNYNEHQQSAVGHARLFPVARDLSVSVRHMLGGIGDGGSRAAAQRHPYYARHRSRRSHGVSRFEAGTYPEPRYSGEPIGGL